jgi:hypothetical protein
MQSVSPNRWKCLPKTSRCRNSILAVKLCVHVDTRIPLWGPILNQFNTILLPVTPPIWASLPARVFIGWGHVLCCSSAELSFQKPQLRQHVTTPNRTSSTSRRQLFYTRGWCKSDFNTVKLVRCFPISHALLILCGQQCNTVESMS